MITESTRSLGVYKRRAIVVGPETGADCRRVAGVPSFASETLRSSLLEVPAELRKMLREDAGRDRVFPLRSKLGSRSLTLSLPGSQLCLTSRLLRPSASRSRLFPSKTISGVPRRTTSSSKLRVLRWG